MIFGNFHVGICAGFFYHEMVSVVMSSQGSEMSVDMVVAKKRHHGSRVVYQALEGLCTTVVVLAPFKLSC